MNHKHIDTVPKKRQAFAPYNFVELPDEVVEAQDLPSGDRYHSNRNTGRIKCTLTTESPLYTRCGWHPDDFAKYSEPPTHKTKEERERWEKDEKAKWEKERRDILAHFFSYPGSSLAAIPGSSIRGMLRTLVEIVTFSKLSKVADQKLVYRAVGDTTSLGKKYRERLLKKHNDGSYTFIIQAGYLLQQSDNWKIQPARPLVQGALFARIEQTNIPQELIPWHEIKNAYQIAVSIDPVTTHSHNQNRVKLKYAKAHLIEEKQKKGEFNGILVKTGQAPRKHMEFVFGKPTENPNDAIPITNDMIQEYREQITDGQIDILGQDGALRPMQPVFYIVEKGKLVFFGHSMMFRLPYENSIGKFIPDELKQTNLVDIADAIFGFTRETKQDERQKQSCAGRVSFSDAQYKSDKNGIWYTGNLNDTVIPKILASPKPTTFQHYLVQSKETNADRKNLKHYASEPIKETVIRGHKLYWHKGSNPDFKHPNPSTVSNTQTTEIQPINPGVTFKFTIHFENLTNVELGALLWVLSLSSDKSQTLETGKPDQKYCFSLGMGKPLGMGAVKIDYELYLIDYELYLSDRISRYSSLFDGNQWNISELSTNLQQEKDYVKAFEKFMLDENKGISEQDHPDGRRATCLKEVPRIEMLLAMLRCDESPDTEQTRYMKIEPDNEYKNRPVLPTPLQVAGIKDNRRLHNQVSSGVKKKDNVIKSERQVEVTTVVQSQKFTVEQILEATVTSINGNKVTYQMLEVLKLTEKEPKKAAFLQVGQVVRVKITVLKEDGNVKSVKYLD